MSCLCVFSLAVCVVLFLYNGVVCLLLSLIMYVLTKVNICLGVKLSQGHIKGKAMDLVHVCFMREVGHLGG